MDKAIDFLQTKKIKPKKQIIVGIIDSGLDTTSVDILPALWKNPQEKQDRKDNDNNGYTDDLHGWNFLGTKDGTFNMTSAGSEEFREFKRLYPKYKGIENKEAVQDTAEFTYYELMKKKAGIMSYIKYTAYTAVKDEAYQKTDSILKTLNINTDTLTIQGLMQLHTRSNVLEQAIQALFTDLLKIGEHGLWKDARKAHDKNFALMKRRLESIEKDTDKRLLMGDDMKNPEDRFYGNHTLQVEGCDHGTFVAGIVAGQGVKDSRMKGVWPQARLMIVRAVGNGDEYDKDVASAIRYAVDNGATVINLSLGKYTSPDADMVNQAIAYAQKKDVLIIQAAGNNSRNIDLVPYFPSAKDQNGKTFKNYMRVGASDQDGNPCTFSNYGQDEVDVFAPGENIISVGLTNTYSTQQGTSFAAPIVSGIAAMLRSCFPKLKAHQIKEIICQSVQPTDQLKKHCRTGGIVDALKAVQLAVTYK